MKNLALFYSLIFVFWSGFGQGKTPLVSAKSDTIKINLRSLVSSGDLNYDTPVIRSDEGMPVGNGKMGSFVWTTPDALRMQINRVDVFPMDKTTNSFPVRHSDYVSGCGYVDVNMTDYGENVFTGKEFNQHLELYDAVLTARGKGVSARILAWNERDVMAVEINDQREKPLPVSIDLRMLRYVLQTYDGGKNFELTSKHAVEVTTANHSATSRLEIRGKCILLIQEFRENKYYNASAIAISIPDRESMPRYYNELTVRLTATPAKGRFTILITSAASFNPEENVADLAMKELEKANSKSFEELLTGNKMWWHEFWSKSFINMSSDDGIADFIQQNYVYYQYIMGSASRGLYPPRFGGMLWYSTGDQHAWGSQYWWYNQSCTYDCMPPVNRFDLMEPFYSMYSRNYDSFALAARQQWGSKGIWVPETHFFNGLEELPENIAKEMQDLYLLRKPWNQRSKEFDWWCEPKLKHEARYNWAGVGNWIDGRYVFTDKGSGPFGHGTHIFSAAGKLSYLYWLRYEYTMDKEFLRNRAYPMLKGVIEFYRSFPNVKKDSAGTYNIHNVNNHELAWEAKNAIDEVAVVQGITPILIRASEILGMDAEMRPLWKEFKDHFAPLPTSESTPEFSGYWVSSASKEKFRDKVGLKPKPQLVPAINFDLLNIATRDKKILKEANATFKAVYPNGTSIKTMASILDQGPQAAAHLGRAEDVKYLIYNQMRHIIPEEKLDDPQLPLFKNRMTLQEGEGAISSEHLGSASAALHRAIMQSVPAAPGEDPVIYLFPAWPKEWNSTFTLGARGGFLVTSSIQKGEIGIVQIKSQVGGKCKIKNPWPGKKLDLYRAGRKAETLSGEFITFVTRQNETVKITRYGIKPGTVILQ